MVKAWCADCNGTAKQQEQAEWVNAEMPKRRDFLSPWFDARWPGQCAGVGCGESFGAGEPIQHNQDGPGYLAACCGKDEWDG